MSDYSAIEWTDATWPVVAGCERISPGCANCYAVRDARRLAGNPNPKVSRVYAGTVERQGNGQLDWTGLVRPLPDRLDWPLKWRKPRRIFVCNESDLFHEDVPDDFIDQVFAVMALAPQHTFQILTKRPERMRAYLSSVTFGDSIISEPSAYVRVVAAMDMPAWLPAGRRFLRVPENWPLPNAWLGVSVENQHFADERIPLLLKTPAAVRFISAEPLLGRIDLERAQCSCPWPADAVRTRHLLDCPADTRRPDDQRRWRFLDWVIPGGESSPNARPCDVAWIRSILRQCKHAGTPVFVKQLGAHVVTRNDDGWEGDTPTSWPMDTRYDEDLTGFRDGYQGAPVRVRLHDRKGGDPAEWPEDLRVREWPRARA